MIRIHLFTLTALFLAAGLSAQPFRPDQTGLDQAELIDSALSQVGMTRDDFRFDQDEMAGWGGDTWRLSYFTMLHKNPFKLPKYANLNLAQLKTDATNITAMSAFAARKIDLPVRRGLIGDPLEKYLKFPDSVHHTDIATSRNMLTGDKFASLRRKVDLVWEIANDKDFAFAQAVDKIDKTKYRKQILDFFVHEKDDDRGLVEELAGMVDFKLMTAGAEDFIEAARRMADSISFCQFPDSRQEIKTRHGLIVIGTAGKDKYEYLDAPLLIIDGGGDDIYKFPTTLGEAPYCIIIDAGGNDLYSCEDSTIQGFGGAIIGLSVLIDMAGDDIYETVNASLGCGIFGAGVLIDYAGKDVYSGRHLTEGCGVFGIGILVDSSGDDSLYCWSSSQGFGFTRGCGLLVNVSGNDQYVAEDTKLFSPSSQTKDHNSSLAQGCGFGRRADYADGHSWAGGVGILADLDGNDVYSAGLFAQGCGYWYAVGSLYDAAGDDKYNGVWYVQGSAAHFAIGYLDDFSGNDVYDASLNMAVGAGHDFSIGYLNERGGNDVYSVPNLSLGGGNANGMGIFHDHSGDDTYTTKAGTTLGRANGSDQGPRKYLGCFGLFIDGDGNDQYLEPYAGNGRRWIGPKNHPENPDPFELGIGIDK